MLPSKWPSFSLTKSCSIVLSDYQIGPSQRINSFSSNVLKLHVNNIMNNSDINCSCFGNQIIVIQLTTKIKPELLIGQLSLVWLYRWIIGYLCNLQCARRCGVLFTISLGGYSVYLIQINALLNIDRLILSRFHLSFLFNAKCKKLWLIWTKRRILSFTQVNYSINALTTILRKLLNAWYSLCSSPYLHRFDLFSESKLRQYPKSHDKIFDGTKFVSWFI